MRKTLFIMLIVLVISMPFMLAFDVMEGTTPEVLEDEPTEDETSPFASAGATAAKITSGIFGVVLFILFTVQGGEIIKIIIPHQDDFEDFYLNYRPKIIVVVIGLGVALTFVQFDFNFFALFETMEGMFEIDPLFGQIISALAVAFTGGLAYDFKKNKLAELTGE